MSCCSITRQLRPAQGRPRRRSAARLCWSAGVRLCLLLLLALALLLARLLQGPLTVPGLADWAEEAAAAEGVSMRVGAVVISLGRAGAASGLGLRDVAAEVEGTRVRAATLDVDARLSDLLAGAVRPTALRARGVRVALAPGESPPPDPALLWEAAGAPWLGRLRRIDLADLRLEAGGRRLEVVEARLRREGAAARLEATLALDAMPATLTARLRADGTERLSLERLRLDAAALSLDAAGSLRREGAGTVLDLALADLRLDRPELFAEPLAFDGGALAARWRPGAGVLEVAEARLSRGDLHLAARGRLTEGTQGWTGDLRLEGRGLTVADLKRHWPLPAADNARDWVVEHLEGGRIPEVLAELHLGPPVPEVALSLRFEDLATRYLDAMSPIRRARGRAQLTLDGFHLQVAEATVGEGLRLDGSDLAITDLRGAVTPADIRLRARGPTAAVLALIDEEPLGLVGKLGLPLADVEGEARVTARLGFPLLDDLPIERVEVAADARLRDLAMTVETPRGARRVAAERLRLDATTERMILEGRARVDGLPLEVAWREDYGATEARRVEIAAEITPERLAGLGLALPAYRSGPVRAQATLEGTGPGIAFDAEADLAEADLAVEPLRWRKPAGTPGRLTLRGEAGPEGIAVAALALEAAGLDVAGAADLDAQGALREARLERFVLDERADLAGTVRPKPGGGLAVRLEGPLLDLSDYLSDPPDTAPAEDAPITIEARIDRLVLTPTLRLAGVDARLSRTAAGRIEMALSGAAGSPEGPPFEARYARSATEPGEMRLTTPDAGRFLSGLNLFVGATGGEMTLEAAFAEGTETDLAGRADIGRITVRGDSTFGTILEEGGVEEAAAEVQGDGLTFSSIEIPFAYRDGVLTLEDAIARSPAVAIKVGGRVDEAAGTLDLAGVISPAYALTGVLDQVPVLSQILSGGRGEGILAMTFAVEGPLQDPSFSVNPLSLLTPGFLREVFEGGGAEPSERFMDSLGPKQ